MFGTNYRLRGPLKARRLVCVFAPLALAAPLALLASIGSAQAQTVTYNFVPDNWVVNTGTGYAKDGGVLFGTLTYDWTTHTVVSSDITSTGATSLTTYTTTVYTSLIDHNSPYTVGTATVSEAIGTASGYTVFVDFTLPNLTNFFPGDLSGVHSSQIGGGLQRVLETTVLASIGSPIDTNAPYYLASNLDLTVFPIFEGGTLRIDTAGPIADNFGLSAVAGNTIDPRGTSTVFTGQFVGPGGISINDSLGGGTVILSNAGGNSYTGQTTITSGTLQAGAAGAFSPGSAVSLANSAGASLNLAGFNETIGGLSGGGAAGGGVALGGGVLTVNGGGVYAGAITGAGGLTAGTGALVLNGVNTYTGATTVSGLLEVGDASHAGAVVDSHLGGVQVNSGGTLEGFGTVNGAVSVASGGVVAPGSGVIGTLNVGAYTQAAGGTLQVAVSPVSASQLHVAGAANLNGTLAANFAAGVYSPMVYTVVNAGSVSGTFSGLSATGAPSSIVYGLYYNPAHTQADLVVTPKLSGEVFTALITATIDRGQELSNLTLDHVDDPNISGGLPSFTKSAGDKTTAWLEPMTGKSWTSASNGADKFNNSHSGVAGGFNRPLPGGATVGVAFAYTEEALVVGGASLSSAQGHTAFGAVSLGAPSFMGLRIGGGAFYMSNDWTTTRNTLVAGVATAKPNASTAGAAVQVAFPLFAGQMTPSLRFTHISSDPGSTESGAGPLDLVEQQQTTQSNKVDLGTSVYHNFTVKTGWKLLPEFKITPALAIDIDHELSSTTRNVTVALAYAPGTGFTAPAVQPASTDLRVRAEVRATQVFGFQLYAGASFMKSDNQSQASAGFGGRLKF